MEGVCRLRTASPAPRPAAPASPPRRQGPKEAIKGEKKTRQGGRESGARCLPPRLVPTRALRQEGGFPTRTQRPSPTPHGPAMNPGQREHRRRQLLDRRISPPLEESRRWAWWAETPVLVDAKPGGSPYVHCESTGKSGGSLREGRKFAAPPLGEGPERLPRSGLLVDPGARCTRLCFLHP